MVTNHLAECVAGGFARPGHPQTEDYWGKVNPIGTRSCYDEGKRCAETLFFDYHRQYKLKIKVARIFNTYGPRMHPNDGRVVSNFIVQALKGEPITIYGDGVRALENIPHRRRHAPEATACRRLNGRLDRAYPNSVRSY